MKLIKETELSNLLMDSECLRRLESMGVDNWLWYGDALFRNPEYEGTLEDWEENELPNLLENYKDYIPKESDNYNFE